MVKLNKKGFTLAELLIVVAVIAVLVAVAIPTFANQLEKSRQGVDLSNLRGAYAAARLAELDGEADGVKFVNNNNRVKFKKGNDSEAATKNDTPADETESIGLVFWYDPDSSSLIQATEITQTANTAFNRAIHDSAHGKAQGGSVIADTSGLPGSGQSQVIYTNAQFTATDTDNGGHIGTIDRAVRVVFVMGDDKTFTLHEIAFAETAGEALVKFPGESPVLKTRTHTANAETLNADDGNTVNIDITGDLLSGADKYTFGDPVKTTFTGDSAWTITPDAEDPGKYEVEIPSTAKAGTAEKPENYTFTVKVSLKGGDVSQADTITITIPLKSA